MASRIVVLALGFWLAGCAHSAQNGAAQVSADMLAAIKRYYESHAAEENNACSAPMMSGVTRSQLVSEGEGSLVVDVTYMYTNFTNRSGRRCRGFGNRRFTLSRQPGGFSVTGMTGEYRRGASWRLIDARQLAPTGRAA